MPVCDECGKRVKDDGTGCICVVTGLRCTCGAVAPEDIIHSDDDSDKMTQWVAAHVQHGRVIAETASLQ